MDSLNTMMAEAAKFRASQDAAGRIAELETVIRQMTTKIGDLEENNRQLAGCNSWQRERINALTKRADVPADPDNDPANLRVAITEIMKDLEEAKRDADRQRKSFLAMSVLHDVLAKSHDAKSATCEMLRCQLESKAEQLRQAENVRKKIMEEAQAARDKASRAVMGEIDTMSKEYRERSAMIVALTTIIAGDGYARLGDEARRKVDEAIEAIHAARGDDSKKRDGAQPAGQPMAVNKPFRPVSKESPGEGCGMPVANEPGPAPDQVVYARKIPAADYADLERHLAAKRNRRIMGGGRPDQGDPVPMNPASQDANI